MNTFDCVVVDQYGSNWLFICEADTVGHAEEQALDEDTVRVVLRITRRNAMADEVLLSSPWSSVGGK